MLSESRSGSPPTKLPHAGIPAFANQYVAFDSGVLCLFFRKEAHFKQIGQIEEKPADVQVAEIALWLALILRFIEHLSERVQRNLADPLARPRDTHRGARSSRR